MLRPAVHVPVHSSRGPPRPGPAVIRRLLRHPATQAVLAASLGGYLAFVYRTTRWSVLGWEHMHPFTRDGRTMVVAFWHERLPMMPMLWRLAARDFAPHRTTRAHVLVSRHRDGRLIGDVVGRFDLAMVHASTGRGGAAGMRALLRLLAAGDVVAITPDGPRGPARVPAPGVAQLAAAARVPVLPCAAATTRRRVLGSWDRMRLPLPFGRGVVACGPLIEVPRADPLSALAAIGAGITAAGEAADAWAARAPGPGAA